MLLALVTGCAFGGLAAVARTMEQPIGDLRIATTRLAGITAVAMLAGFVNLGWTAGEVTLEILIFAVLLAVGAAFLFKLPAHRATTFVAFTLSLFFAVFAIAELVAWAM